MGFFGERWEGFENSNVPPGVPNVERLPICPYYHLISVCAELTGQGIDTNRFCGKYVNYKWSRGVVDYPVGIEDSSPAATCSKVARELKDQIKQVEKGKAEDNSGGGKNDITLTRWKEVIVMGSPIKTLASEEVTDIQALSYARNLLAALMRGAAGDGGILGLFPEEGENCPQRPR